MNLSALNEIKQNALENHIPIIMDETLAYIKNLFQNHKIDNILEIGTAVGYSAICFTEFLKEKGLIDTIEKDEDRVRKAKINIVQAEVEDKINLLEGDAIEILPSIQQQYDMIFIDAAKGKYPFFLQEALRLLKPDGVILADNILFKGYVMGEYHKHKQRTAVRNLREYIQQVTENPNLKTEIIEIGDGLAVTTKKI